MFHRLSWALTGALGIILVLTLARVVSAGPLDPPGPVGSTMRTIDELLPSWGKQLSSSGGCASKRFTCVLPTSNSPTGDAVLDHETGLVWQRSPGTSLAVWSNARNECVTDAFTGDREGWRLPTVQELQSLRDQNTGDFLPIGHPFTGGTAARFWTSTPDDMSEGAKRWVVSFDPNLTDLAETPELITSGFKFWCVRGGSQEDARTDVSSWSRILQSGAGCLSQRWSCVMSGAAVLDNETGLVWERTPSVATELWVNAPQACETRNIGGRYGWRLPTMPELMSLVDTTVVAPSPSLPAGNPFNIGAGADPFWSSTADPANTAFRREVHFMGDLVGQPGYFASGSPSASFRAWCVRGATGQ